MILLSFLLLGLDYRSTCTFPNWDVGILSGWGMPAAGESGTAAATGETAGQIFSRYVSILRR